MTKRVFAALLMMVAIVGSIQAQGLFQRRLPLRPGSLDSAYRAVCDNVATALKGRGSVESRNFNELVGSANKGDASALYELALVCRRKGIVGDQWMEYISQAASNGDYRAKLVIALDLHGKVVSGYRMPDHNARADALRGIAKAFLSFDIGQIADKGSVVEKDRLELVQGYYDDVVKAGYGCVTNLTKLLTGDVKKDREIKEAAEKAEQERKEKEEKEKEEKLELERILREGMKSEKNEAKSKFEDCLALAETNDGKACYDLAVKYAKGDGVQQNSGNAAKLLKKSYDANYPQAVFAVALEGERVLGKCADKEVLPASDKCFLDVYGNVVLLKALERDVPLPGRPTFEFLFVRGITNDVYVAKVRKDYTRAKDLGVVAAVEELARFDNRVMLAKKALEEEKLWSSWPKKLNGADTLKIAEQAEKKFNCTFYGDFSYGALTDWGVSFTNSWKRGCGVSLIAEKQIWSGRAVEKFDSEGRLVWVCSMDGLTEDAEELNWISVERRKALEEGQLKWATGHGMTLDEAKAKYAKWKEEHPVGRFPGGSLRARRLQRQQEAAAAAAKQREEQSVKDAERQAQAEREKQQREAERAEQRQQLLAIQEELRRVREAKAAAEKK